MFSFLYHHRFNNRFSKTQPCGQCGSQYIQQCADEQGDEEDGRGKEHFALYDRYAAIQSIIAKREEYVEHPATPYVESSPGQTQAQETAHECQFVDDIDPLMWTLLHEIGHFETAEIVDPEDDLANRALFAITSKEQARGDKELQDLYFSMDSEWQATEWAIDWVANHHKLAVALSWVLSK